MDTRRRAWLALAAFPAVPSTVLSAVLPIALLAVGCQTDRCPPGVTDSIFCRSFVDANVPGCTDGATCSPPDDLCAVGVMRCLTADGPTCEVTGRLSEGDPCGGGGFQCAADGTCSICLDGAVCNTGNPCLGGHMDCGATPPTCVPDTPADGQPCGTGGVCGGEVCSECIPDVICNTGNPCTRGITRCVDASTTECVPDGSTPAGVSCGEGLACNGSGGCDACDPGAICNTGNPCTTGRTDCGSGSPVCVPDGDVSPGTGCGSGGICSGAGECSECIDGIVCNTGNPCTQGTQTCPSGNPVCTADRNLPSGVRCGVGMACDGSGNCSMCVPGEPCVTAACQEGTTDCATGMAVCLATGPAPAGAVCRPRADACDVEEVCDGTGAACPADRFAPSGTACIDRGMCDGAGICIPFCVDGTPCSTGNDCEIGTTDCSSGVPMCVSGGPEAFGTVCRASTGECDAEETCDGVGLTCPADADQPPGTVCTGGVCDTMGMCVACVDGAPCTTANPCEAGTLDCSSGMPVCQPSGPATAGTLCRASAGICDVEERCDGTTTACPPDAFDATTVCRASAAVCDADETCNGGGPDCPPDLPAPVGTICPTGVCNDAAMCVPCTPGVACSTGNDCEDGVIDCSGGAPACVSAGPRANGTVCRAAASACDAEEVCDGTSLTCPPDIPLAAGTTCRPVVGACDVPEVCDGIRFICPPNSVSPAGTTCRAAAGACDAPEACDGVRNTCPPDLLATAGTVCRAALDVCDQDEVCSGTAPTCPADQLRPLGSICRMAVDVCDQTETCTGADVACPPNQFTTLGTVCPAGVCDGSGGCSMCGGICPARPNATTTCGGSCGYACLAGYDDCNGSAPDGCEINTDMDIANCGACGSVCPTPANANPTCSGAVCGYGCFPSFADCNGSGGDGCEINTSTDIFHCGGCGNACPGRANATTSCTTGSCGFSCNPTYADCNGSATDGCEVDTSVNLANCGACGNACPSRPNSSPTCTGGACGFACSPSYDDCNGSAADGCETDLDTTITHCGACGNTCPNRANSSRTCVGGACGFTCNAGYDDCNASATDGCETNLNADVTSCGVCGNTCPTRPNSTPLCTAGACGFSCNAGYADCNGNPSDGCEVFTGTDLNNCGGCGTVCPTRANATRTCAAGSCGFTCDASYGDCNGNPADGCENFLDDDALNCGGCGTVCPTRPNSSRFCSGGACGYNCDVGFGECNGSQPDGCEVNLQTSPTNCGSCGFTCNIPNAVESCAAGICAINSCDPGFYDVDGATGNGCECLDSTPANTCTSATNAGTLNAGGTANFTGKVVSDTESDWYQVSFPIVGGAGGQLGGSTPTIGFSSNPGNVFRFDLVGGSCGGPNPWCGNGLTSFTITDNVSDVAQGFRTRTTPWPTTVWVRVYRIMSGLSCADYSISFSRP